MASKSAKRDQAEKAPVTREMMDRLKELAGRNVLVSVECATTRGTEVHYGFLMAVDDFKAVTIDKQTTRIAHLDFIGKLSAIKSIKYTGEKGSYVPVFRNPVITPGYLALEEHERRNYERLSFPADVARSLEFGDSARRAQRPGKFRPAPPEPTPGWFDHNPL